MVVDGAVAAIAALRCYYHHWNQIMRSSSSGYSKNACKK